MSVRYEFLFSVYSAPPFITEILMVLLVIVILAFPCNSYLSRYVSKNPVLPSEVPPGVDEAEILHESYEVVTDESETDAGYHERGLFTESDIHPEFDSDLSESGPDESSTDDSSSDNPGPDDFNPGGTGPSDPGPNDPGPAEPRLEEPNPEEPGPEEPSPEERGPEEPSTKEPGPEDTAGYERSQDSFQYSMDEKVVVEVHANRQSVRKNSQDNTTSDATHTQGKHRSVQVLYSKISNYPVFSHSETDENLKKLFIGDNSALDKMFLEADRQSVFHDIPGDCITPRNEIQRGEMGSLCKQQTGNISASSGNRKDLKLQNLNTEKSPFLAGDNSAVDKMFLEADRQSVFHDIPGDCITPRNEIQRGEMGSLYKQQSGNISAGSANRKDLKLQNWNTEKSRFLADTLRLKLSHKEETFSQDNSFSSVSSSTLFINKYKRKLSDTLTMKHKRIKLSSNKRYAGTNASSKSQQSIPFTEYLATDNSVKGFLMEDTSHISNSAIGDLSRLKQYELLTSKEETPSQEDSVISLSSSSLFSNNSKLAGSLKMKLKSSNRRPTERSAPQKSQQFIPCTEHSMTDHSGKGYFTTSHSHISNFHNWCHTIDVDDLSNLSSMNENAFFKHLPFTPIEGEDIHQEKYNHYNKALKGRCNFESKESRDNYKGRFETADGVKNNAIGPNTSYCNIDDKLVELMKKRRCPLIEEDPNNDKDPIYFESYSQAERSQQSMNGSGIGKFKNNCDVNATESTLSNKLHIMRIEEARLFVELLKEVHNKNIRMKSKSEIQSKFNDSLQLVSDESGIHYSPSEPNEYNIGHHNGNSVSETINVSELKYLLANTPKKNYFC